MPAVLGLLLLSESLQLDALAQIDSGALIRGLGGSLVARVEARDFELGHI